MAFYDDFECQPEVGRESRLLKELTASLRRAAAAAPFWAERLKDVDLNAELDRESLQHIPLLQKTDLPALQDLQPPFCGLTTVDAAAFPRLFSWAHLRAGQARRRRPERGAGALCGRLPLRRHRA